MKKVQEELRLSSFVKGKRKALDFTQVELAKKAGIGLRLLREIEQEKHTLRIQKINQLLNLFGYELGPVKMKRE